MAKGFRRHKHVKIMHAGKKKAAKKKKSAKKKMPLQNKGLTRTKGGAITRTDLQRVLKAHNEILPHGYEIRKKKK